MLAYSARRLELIALFENREYPSTDRRILGAFCAAAMGTQNAWTTRSSLKTSTVIVGTNLQKTAEILYLRVRRKLEGCCSSSVPELGRRFPSINNFLPERQDTGERKAPLLRSLPSIVREVCRPTPRGPRRTQGNQPPPPLPLEPGGRQAHRRAEPRVRPAHSPRLLLRRVRRGRRRRRRGGARVLHR